MYTIYFKINYSYGTFNHWYYISKIIRPGDSYSPLDDSELMHQLDERVQLELDEYFYPSRRESENCDIDLLIISYQEYLSVNVLSKFDME